MESESNLQKTRGVKGLGALSIALGAFASVIVTYSVHAGMTHNPISLPFEQKVNAQMWIPEGWKFFTRNPREERVAMLVQKDGQWINGSRTPNANPSNAFGLDRLGRAQGLEVALLLENVPSEAWSACKGDTTSCLQNTAPTIHRTNISPNPSLCGQVGFVSQKPVPWAWANQGLHVEMPANVIRMDIQC